MALWYDCGNGFAKAHMARCVLGADVYLCCPGPSLVPVPRGAGVYVAALTKAWPAVDPDTWIGMDDPLCYDHRLWWTGFIKIARAGMQNLEVGGRAIRQAPNAFFADVERMSVQELFQRRSHETTFLWHEHSLGVAMHYLTWLGGKRIHLVGCDLGGQTDWHFGDTLPDNLRRMNRNLYAQQVEFLRRFAMIGRLNGIELISCTPDSPINNHIPYLPLNEALEMSRSKIPEPGTMLHCQQAVALRTAKVVTTEDDSRNAA